VRSSFPDFQADAFGGFDTIVSPRDVDAKVLRSFGQENSQTKRAGQTAVANGGTFARYVIAGIPGRLRGFERIFLRVDIAGLSRTCIDRDEESRKIPAGRSLVQPLCRVPVTFGRGADQVELKRIDQFRAHFG
jgi:hypothetical protein